MKQRVLIARILERDIIKPQDINAINIIARFGKNILTDYYFRAFYYENIDSRVQERELDGGIKFSKLIAKPPYIAGEEYSPLKRKIRLTAHEVEIFFKYLSQHDIIFYPGSRSMHIFALMLSKFFKNCKIISTFEGMIGTKEMEERFSEYIGHKVYMIQQSRRKGFVSINKISDRIISISPIVSDYIKFFYGRDTDILPLGVDGSIFFAENYQSRKKLTVICVGRVSRLKRPKFFIHIASMFNDINFTWYGDGPLRKQMIAHIKSMGLKNVSFPGSIDQLSIAREMRKADIFIFPSLTEGWGKAIQEAQACGLPVVAFGYYNTPLITHGHNGLIAWSDEEFIAHTEELIKNEHLRYEIAKNSAIEAKKLLWEKVAPLWERKLSELIKELTYRDL